MWNIQWSCSCGKPFLCIYQTMRCEHVKNCIILYTLYTCIYIYILHYLYNIYIYTVYITLFISTCIHVSLRDLIIKFPQSRSILLHSTFVEAPGGWGLRPLRVSKRSIKLPSFLGQWSKKTSGIVSKKYPPDPPATWLVGKSPQLWRLLRKSSNRLVDFPARHVWLLEGKSM